MDKISSYETLFIVDAQQGDDGIKALVDKFTGLIAANGTVESVDEWGKRKLAYPINDLTEGYYVLVNFKSAPTLPLELERVFGITDGILRSIVNMTLSPLSPQEPPLIPQLEQVLLTKVCSPGSP